MAISFPASPALNQTYTHNSIIWTYNGTAWTKSSGGGGASLPSQATNSGKYLTTDGTAASWGTINALPTQATNSGKYLTTDGTSASWGTLSVTPTAVSDQANSSTGYFDLPAGTTAERPASPTTGAMRLNTETNYLEMYNGTIWVSLQYAGAMLAATYVGATPSTDGNFRVLTFNTSGSFTPSIVPIGTTVEYLIVAGGGGGATDIDVGGGGGGGGLLTGTFSPSAQAYTITVGAGGPQGAGADNSGTGSGNNGTKGVDSSAFGLTAVGGGYGGTRNQAGGLGGSGGGGGDGGAAGGAGTAGPPRQGYDGGTAPAMNSNGGWDVGGGGGAGGAANSWLPGPGLANAITGTAVTYAAGARGQLITAGAENTGNGGSNRAGGKGVVILRYRFQ